MKILFSGDSFTYGDELENHERDRYSKLVSDHFHAEEINLATNGASNDKIVRNVFEYLSLWDVDAVVIQFSVLSRFDVYQHNDPAVLIKNAIDPLNNEGWVSIAPSNIGGEFGHVDHFRKSRAIPYYKHIQDNITDQQRYFQQILLLQMYLKQKNIPYVMLHLEDFYYKSHHVHRPNYYMDLCEEFECIIPNLIGNHFGEYYCPDLRKMGHPDKHGTHPNVKGHRLIADHIISKL